MSDGFTEMIDAAVPFLAELAENNSKAWFEPRKDHYAEVIRKPAELMAAILAEDLGRAVGQGLQPKVFRIHRDVRFSKDKTPYKTHLHMMWSHAKTPAVLFFGVEPGQMVVGCGVMAFDAAQLVRYRAMLGSEGAAFATLIAAGRLSDHGPAPLKRVPSPYAADHRHAELLRRKNLIVTRDMAQGWRGTLVKAIGQEIAPLLPLYHALNQL